MRAQLDTWFSDYLLRIGNGTEETFAEDYVKLPDDIIIKWGSPPEPVGKGKGSIIHHIDRLIERVFPQLETYCISPVYMWERAILSTKNEHVDAVNEVMIDRFPGDEHVFYSFDSVEDDTHNSYPLDFLNSLTPNGLPPHQLKVKKNCPVILLRNLDPHHGLCNGTRMVVRSFKNNVIDAEIVNGQHAGDRVFIPGYLCHPRRTSLCRLSSRGSSFHCGWAL